MKNEELQSAIARFKQETGYTLEVSNEKPYYGGYLDLRGTGITSLPEGLTVGGSLDLEGCTGITSLPEGLTVGGSLYLRGTSAYKDMSLDDIMSYEEAIAAYRTITGACSAGTRDYIENRLPKPHKSEYTIREIIQLTKGEYRSEVFKEFFIKSDK